MRNKAINELPNRDYFNLLTWGCFAILISFWVLQKKLNDIRQANKQ